MFKRIFLLLLAVLGLGITSLAAAFLIVREINVHRTQTINMTCQDFCHPQLDASSELQAVGWFSSDQKTHSFRVEVSWKDKKTSWQTQTLGVASFTNLISVHVVQNRALVVWQGRAGLFSSQYINRRWSNAQLVHRGAITSYAVDLNDIYASIAWSTQKKVGLIISRGGNGWKNKEILRTAEFSQGLSLASNKEKLLIAWVETNKNKVRSIKTLQTSLNKSKSQISTFLTPNPLHPAALPYVSFLNHRPLVIWGNYLKTIWYPSGRIWRRNHWTFAPKNAGSIQSGYPIFGSWWGKKKGLYIYTRGIGYRPTLIAAGSGAAQGRVFSKGNLAVAGWFSSTGPLYSLFDNTLSEWLPAQPLPIDTSSTSVALTPLTKARFLVVSTEAKSPSVLEWSEGVQSSMPLSLPQGD